MDKTKRIVICAAVLLLAAVFAAVAAAVYNPFSAKGSYERDILDRVRFTVSPTEFTFDDVNDAEDPIEFTFTLTAEKTEPDFYAVLNSVTLTGANYESIRFQTETGGDNAVPNELLLPAENGKTVEVRWAVTVRIPAETAESGKLQLAIRYTSGITADTADEHILIIPISITIP